MKSVLIIAEAGVNHNGDLATALGLVESAAECGADAVKFQSFIPDQVASAGAQLAQYQKEGMPVEPASQLEMLRSLALSEEDHERLVARCRACGLQFMSTPFDIPSVDLLDRLDVSIFKVASGEITNLFLLRRIARLRKPLLVSTGMSSLRDVEAALDVLFEAGVARGHVTLMHATTQYPTAYPDVNLRAMQTLRNAFHVEVGYSDHTLGIEVALAAVAMGATVIEKHFTLDRDQPGPDHRASLDPGGMRALVTGIRNVESALGDGIKRPAPSELPNRAVARRSLVARRAIATGEAFSEENVTAKRPGTGMSPMRWDEVLGRLAHRSFEQDELISDR